ncbi:MAG TPA: hypothetical protein VKF36_22960 [Syntrophorhabdales bacterium]|nr:hypothetical protein [Syntrophorhabdales bacterium]
MLRTFPFSSIRKDWSFTPHGREDQVNDNRVRTFIELTRQALEEDRIGQTDLSYSRKLTLNRPRSDRKREGKGLRRKG